MNQKKNYPSFVAVFLNSMTPVSGGRPWVVAAAIRRVSSNEWPVTGTFKHLRKRYIRTSTNGDLSTAANVLVDSPYIDSCLNLAVVDPGEGYWGPGSPPYFSTKMRPEGPKKCFLETAPPPPYLKVWIRYCLALYNGHFLVSPRWPFSRGSTVVLYTAQTDTKSTVYPSKQERLLRTKRISG